VSCSSLDYLQEVRRSCDGIDRQVPSNVSVEFID